MEKEKKGSRQPYEKPTVKRFTLRPEEAVLGACKAASSGGPGGGSSCHPILCKTVGS